MHPNPSFRTTETAQSLAFARDRGFGTLALNADPAPLLSHVPFLLSGDGDMAEVHLVRSNPIARLDLPLPAVLSVTGADGYVSPDWYGTADQVPTWNYVAVHLRGTLHPMPPDTIRDLLARQSAAYEGRLWDKAPWTLDKMTPEVLDKMLRQILPFRLEIDDIQSTWKLGQNKPDAVRLRAAGHVTNGLGSELGELADLMRMPPDA